MLNACWDRHLCELILQVYLQFHTFQFVSAGLILFSSLFLSLTLYFSFPPFLAVSFAFFFCFFFEFSFLMRNIKRSSSSRLQSRRCHDTILNSIIYQERKKKLSGWRKRLNCVLIYAFPNSKSKCSCSMPFGMHFGR